VHGLADDVDAAEMQVEIVAQHLVVVARHVDDARALARLAQQLLDDVVVRLVPVPAALQPPAVDDVADEVDRLGVVVAQEVEQEVGLAAGRAEMDVGEPDRAPAPLGGRACVGRREGRVLFRFMEFPKKFARTSS
jgi:hypothetical protein